MDWVLRFAGRRHRGRRGTRGSERRALSDTNLQRKIVLALPNTRRVPVAVRCVVDLLVKQLNYAVQCGKWMAARWLGSCVNLN